MPFLPLTLSWGLIKQKSVHVIHGKLYTEHSLTDTMASLGVEQGRDFMTDMHLIFSLLDMTCLFPDLSSVNQGAKLGWKYLACKLPLHVGHDMNHSISMFLKESHASLSKYIWHYFAIYTFNLLYKFFPLENVIPLIGPHLILFCPII